MTSDGVLREIDMALVALIVTDTLTSAPAAASGITVTFTTSRILSGGTRRTVTATAVGSCSAAGTTAPVSLPATEAGEGATGATGRSVPDESSVGATGTVERATTRSSIADARTNYVPGWN